jgi:putative ABC transport system permease protein
METLLQDFRYCLRTLRRQPGFALTAILTLAVGIGATTAMFTVVNAIILRPMTLDRPDRVAVVTNYNTRTGTRPISVSAPDFYDWRERNRSFSAFAYYAGWEMSVRVGPNADYATPVLTTEDFFKAVGVRAQIGRLLMAEDYQPNSPLAAVITDGFWRRQFDASPSALGTTVKFNERVFTIVGVLAPGFRFPARADIYYPSWVRPETTSRSAHNYRVIARLADGVTLQQADADLKTIARALEQQYPLTNANKLNQVQSLQSFVVGDSGNTLYTLFGAVAFVLLIACANVANLLLSRVAARRREMLVRAAVGAGRRRLLRQMLTESVVLGVCGGLAGLVFARVCMTALVALAPADLPRLDEVTIDSTVLGFALLISIVASLIFGAAPALQVSRVQLMEGLRQAGKGSASGGRTGWARHAFMIAEVALAVVLVVGAGLLARSLVALASVDMGFSPERLLALHTAVPIAGRDDAARGTAFYRDLLPELRALPGVAALGGAMGVPTRPRSNGGYWIEGGPGFEQLGLARSPQAIFNVVTPDYFRAMRIPLRAGRDFTESDRADAPMVAIVSEALAKASFEGVDPIGRRIRCGLDSPEFMTIVGVVADVRTSGPSRPAQAELYMPYQQHPTYGSALTLVARTDALDPMVLADTMRRKIQQRNQDVPVRVETMAQTVATAAATPRFRTFLLTAFAVVALLLAVAGVYGVMSYSVSQRVSEIGVRVALGASPRDVLRLVMMQAARVTLIGLVIGVGLALGMSELLRSQLFGVKPQDPFVLVSVIVGVSLAAMLASYVPSRRALRVDPMIALRSE